ncbi:MAG: hypothetical protein V2J55_16140 [Candidatus Competibacteraceae bacterium]|jgi:hypothetical protein|nr:hypothetical protein [Candidatus Competibacteraceae bacterium]
MNNDQEKEVQQNEAEHPDQEQEERTVQSRRDFLSGLGKWSKAVIIGTVVGGGVMLTEKDARAGGWINRRGGGGGWINGGGGGGWINRRGGWGGGSWINRR